MCDCRLFQLTCQMLESSLVEIDDAVENAYLKNVVKGLSGILTILAFEMNYVQTGSNEIR